MESTKYQGSQYSNPVPAIQERLDKLDIGYIDIMLLHHPGANDVKAYKAMEEFHKKGLIRLSWSRPGILWEDAAIKKSS